MKNVANYSSDNGSYVGDYASKIGVKDSDRENNADDSDRESYSSSDMNFQ